MAVATPAVVVGAALALFAALLFAAAPTRRLNQLLAALLLVRAATTASYGLLTDASDVVSAQEYARLTVWYSLAGPLLVVLAAREAFPGRAGMRPLVAAGIILTFAGALVHVAIAGAFIDRVYAAGPIFVMVSGPFMYGLAVASSAAECFAVVLAGREAGNASLPPARRTRAALLGSAFALLPLHSAAFFVTYSVFRPEPLLQAPYLARALVTVAAGIIIAASARALVAPLSPNARRATLGILGGLAALGALDGFVGGAGAFAQLPGYEKSVIGVRVAFAALVTIAAIRFGLADLGAGKREQLVATLAAAVAVASALAGLGAAIILFGQNAVGWAVGGAAAIAAGVLPRGAHRDLARRAAAIMLLPMDDPRAIAERARRYAAALEASTSGDDRALLPEGEKLLRGLRADLGVSQREHDMLLQALRSRRGEEGLLLGRYHLEREIGAGATASVLLARDADGRRVVIKRFHGRAADAVLREARLLHAVPHPRVVRVLEVDRREGEVFLVLEHAAGGSLRDLLDRDGPLAPERAAGLVADALEGLAALHAAGIVHRDVKLENILVGADGRAMLGDFGSAGDAPGPDDTVTGNAVEASFATAAPEVLRGEGALPASDVYSAGAVLYRLLTREHYVALDGTTAFEARERVLVDAPRLPHALVPPQLDALLRRMLSKRAPERPTAAQALAALTPAGTREASAPLR